MSASSGDKLNSAEFAEQREQAMLRSRKTGNPNTRMMPEMSKSAKASRPSTSFDGEVAAPDSLSSPSSSDPEDDVDYVATSDAILDALRRIKGHVVYNEKEKSEICEIVGCKPNTKHVRNPLVLAVLCLILGFVLGTVLGLTPGR